MNARRSNQIERTIRPRLITQYATFFHSLWLSSSDRPHQNAMRPNRYTQNAKSSLVLRSTRYAASNIASPNQHETHNRSFQANSSRPKRSGTKSIDIYQSAN